MVVKTTEMQFTFTAGGMRLGISMERCERGYIYIIVIMNCIIFLTMVILIIKSKSIKILIQLKDFQLVLIFQQLKWKSICIWIIIIFKNMEKINSLNPTDPALLNDIGLDEKSKQDMENLYS